MSPKPGDWVRFRRGGVLVIGVVQYVRRHRTSNAEWDVSTDVGEVWDSSIEEIRRGERGSMSDDKLKEIAGHVAEIRAALQQAYDLGRAEEREALREKVGKVCAAHLSNRGAAVAIAVEKIRNVFDARASQDPSPGLMPRDWKHTEKCLTGVSKEKCICWPPQGSEKPKVR